MMKHKRIVAIALAVPLFVLLLVLMGKARNPRHPTVDRASEAKKEAALQNLKSTSVEEAPLARPSEHKAVSTALDRKKNEAIAAGALEAKRDAALQKLKSLSVEEAFVSLKEGELPAAKPYMREAISTAFGHRKKEAIALSIKNVRPPVLKISDYGLVNRSDDFHLAKEVLYAFPDEAFDSLMNIYGKTDPVTKANMVRVLGGMPGDARVEAVLVEALDDGMFCEEEYPEMSGEPLRICDVAYSQLVLRLGIENVLRTIGNSHRIDVRNYHIDILKDLLSKS